MTKTFLLNLNFKWIKKIAEDFPLRRDCSTKRSQMIAGSSGDAREGQESRASGFCWPRDNQVDEVLFLTFMSRTHWPRQDEVKASLINFHSFAVNSMRTFNESMVRACGVRFVNRDDCVLDELLRKIAVNDRRRDAVGNPRENQECSSH